MIKIFIPENFSNEARYVCHVLFYEILGIDTNIIVSGTKDFRIVVEDKVLIFKNSFFNDFDNNIAYLKSANLPKSVIYARNIFTPDNDIPVLYGDSEIKIEKNKIYCGIDIFASSFLLLTRWEEYVCSEKDKHSRFPAKLSTVRKFDLTYRPVVNEYAEMLWNMLEYLNINIKRKQNNYSLKITHDIDFFHKYYDTKRFLRTLGGDIIKRKNPFLLFKTSYEYGLTKKNIKNDPYNTFDTLMDISERYGLVSTFFFMAADTFRNDITYKISDKKVVDTIKHIIDRGHRAELHGSYDSYNNELLFKKELLAMKKVNKDTKECRQHFLRFNNPFTWQMYENNNISVCNNCGFEDDIGFRTGICHSYPAFNIITRKQLRLRISPLMIMDSVFIYNKDIEKEKFIDSCKSVIEKTKKHNGDMQILWHNNSHIDFYNNEIIEILL